MSNEEILKALDNVINDNKNTEVLTGNLNIYNMASSCKFKILNLIEENKRLNNIINRTTEYVQSLCDKGRGCDIYSDIKQEILNQLKDSDKK